MHKRIVLLLFGIFGLPVASLAILLILSASTWRGRLVGIACLLCLVTPLLLTFFRSSVKRRRLKFGIGISCGVLAFFLFAVCYGLAPAGQTVIDASFQQHYLAGGEFSRGSLANLVPEVDQFNLGMTLLGSIDASLRGEQGRKIARDYQNVYQEMERSPEFHALGSNMRYAYAEILPGNYDLGHIYVYIPKKNPEGASRALPVIFFLHGHLGNFKGYMWVLKDLADRYGFAVVAPSFGLGFWGQREGTEAIERARLWCAEQTELDADQIYLACLSNGGEGLVRAGAEQGESYRGLISISGYLDQTLVAAPEFLRQWRGRPVLVIQGSRDKRVVESGVRKSVDTMLLNSVKVEFHQFPEGDHFIFFSDRKRVVEIMGAWLAKN